MFQNSYREMKDLTDTIYKEQFSNVLSNDLTFKENIMKQLEHALI